jgi:hypothetical protein
MRHFINVVFMLGALSGPGLALGKELPVEQRFSAYDALLPACTDEAVLNRLSRSFAARESRFWESGLTLVAHEKTGETAFRSWGARFIPRRFCHSFALFSDGHKRSIAYSIREDLGIIGATWGLEWCVQGLDRQRADAPSCRMARP